VDIQTQKPNFSLMTGSLRLWLWTVARQTNSA
jgi:hypothetical protein